MKYLKHNIVLKFVLTLFIVGFLAGIVAFVTFKPEISSYMNDFKYLITSTHNNTFLMNIGLLSLVFALSITIIGLPVLLFYLFYEGFTIGYTFVSFFTIYKIKGIIFYLLYFILTKLVFTVIIFYFGLISIRFIGRMVNMLAHKDYQNMARPLVNHFIRYIVILGIVCLNSLFIYLFANKIITLFINLIN